MQAIAEDSMLDLYLDKVLEQRVYLDSAFNLD